MRQEDLEELSSVLRDLKVDYVLVGGMAVDLAGFPTGTEDVDFVVSMREFERVMQRIQSHRKFRNVENLGTIGGGQFFTGDGWMDVDFLNPRLFKGKRTGDQFIRYVRRYRSRKTPIGPVALPEVAWYMRLVVPDWEIYIQKILRDVRAGVPESMLEVALAIGRVFGVEDTLRPRVKKAREFLSMVLPRA